MYYQLNSKEFEDYHFHSTPYIQIKRTDSQILFGVSYDLGFN